MEAAVASSIVVSMFSNDCFDTVHRENVGSVSSLPLLLLLVDSNPSFLPSFLLPFPLLSWRHGEIWTVEGEGGGTLILEGGVIETQKSAPLSK